MSKKCGIYLIRQKETNQKYIGQAVDIEHRFKEHINFKDKNSHIDRAISKYGADAFEFTILLECSEEELNDKEIWLISKHGTFYNPHHYNHTKGGDGAKGMCGELHPLFGKSRDNETIDKIKNSWTPEKRAKLSEYYIGENNPMYGKAPWNKGIPQSNKSKNKYKKTKGTYWVWEQSDKIIEDYLNGKSTITLSKEYDCDQGVIINILKKYDIERRTTTEHLVKKFPYIYQTTKRGKPNFELRYNSLKLKTSIHREILQEFIDSGEYLKLYKKKIDKNNNTIPLIKKNGYNRKGKQQYMLVYRGIVLKYTTNKEYIQELIDTGEYIALYEQKINK